MSDPVNNILYAVGGFIIGGFITYIYRIFWYKRTKFIDAGITFRNAFIDILIFLEESDKSSVTEKVLNKTIFSHFIERNIKIHERAYFNFFPYLGIINKRRIRIIWEDYANPKKNNPLLTLSESASLNRYTAYNAVGSLSLKRRRLEKL